MQYTFALHSRSLACPETSCQACCKYSTFAILEELMSTCLQKGWPHGCRAVTSPHLLEKDGHASRVHGVQYQSTNSPDVAVDMGICQAQEGCPHKSGTVCNTLTQKSGDGLKRLSCSCAPQRHQLACGAVGQRHPEQHAQKCCRCFLEGGALHLRAAAMQDSHRQPAVSPTAASCEWTPMQHRFVTAPGSPPWH